VQWVELDGRSSGSAIAKDHSVVALVRSKGSADLPGVDMTKGDARDEGTFTCSLVVKGAESARLTHDPEAVPPMQRVDFSRVQSRLIRTT
jgi:hypothetical protein